MKPDVPDGFNNFFSSVGQVLDNKIPKVDTDPLEYLIEQDFESHATIPPATPSEVENIIKSLNSVGGGIDKINTHILFGTYTNILHHLTFFFNLCLKNAVFPDNLKVAVITPLFKSGSRDKFTNYRPISLLPIFSKILEKIVIANLSTFLESHNILNPFQFGFRRKHSTYMPLAHMYDEITKNLEAKEITCTLYLDLKKAFDTVSIEILLKKLNFIGVKGCLLGILKSYLSNRCQITKVYYKYSKKRPVLLGVPQGSILGPLLFILYVNDLGNISDLAKFYLFADDTAILIKGKNLELLQTKINQLLPLVTKWFHSNRLSLNVLKTHYQLYSMTPSVDLNVYLDGGKIERRECVKYLGVYVDENLKWHSHIAGVVKVISRNIGVMGRVKHFLSPRELVLLYNTLVLPHINYCAVIWGRNYPSNIKRIMILQKRAVRIIENKPYLFPTNTLFIKHMILKFPDIVREQSIMILLAFINNTLPDPIANMFKYETISNTRQAKHFVIPRARNNYRQFSLSCSAPKIWYALVGKMYKYINEVPTNKSTLKKHVRKYIINEYRELTE